MKVTDLQESGIYVPYEEMSSAVISEVKGRLMDTTIALIGGALSVSDVELNALSLATAGLPEVRPVWPPNKKTSLEMAGFLNAYFIRYADWGDTYRLKNAIGGHSSDQIAAVYALCDEPGVTGRNIIELTHLAYQMYAILQEQMFAQKPCFDYTSSLSLTVPVLAAVCRNATRERIQNALNLSACGGMILHQVRTSDITNLKSAAAGIAVSRGLRSYRMSEIIQAPLSMFTGKDGWYNVVAPLEGELLPYDSDVMYASSEVKAFPCFQVGQVPAACAVNLHERLKGLFDRIRSIIICVTESDARYIIRADQAQYPSKQSDADHHILYCVAVGLLYGALTPLHFSSTYLQESHIRALIDLMEVRIFSGEEAESLNVGKGAGSLEVILDDNNRFFDYQSKAEGSFSGLDGSGRLRRLRELVNRKRKMLEEAGGVDLSRIEDMIFDLENHDGPALIDAIQSSLSA
jgi:2-methylcitrate dehydratase PrpD